MNILYLRGYYHNNKKTNINKCDKCSLNIDIYQCEELDYNNKVNYNFTFEELYNTLVENVNLEDYKIIIVNDVSLMILSYYLKNVINKNQIIINVNGFIPNNQNDLENLMFPLLPKLLPKSIKNNMKHIQGCFKESYNDLNNNLKDMMIVNKKKIYTFMDKKNVSNSIKKQINILSKKKYQTTELIPYLEEILSNNITETIKEIIGGKRLIRIQNKYFNVDFDKEIDDDVHNDHIPYQSNCQIWKPSKYKVCEKFSLDSNDECMIDMGRHVQHSFNCYSYFFINYYDLFGNLEYRIKYARILIHQLYIDFMMKLCLFFNKYININLILICVEFIFF